MGVASTAGGDITLQEGSGIEYFDTTEQKMVRKTLVCSDLGSIYDGSLCAGAGTGAAMSAGRRQPVVASHSTSVPSRAAVSATASAPESLRPSRQNFLSR